ncbi:MAG: cyclic nucleotide-binding domain-containing protein [Synergistaceae bacterium]|nr:cyclic nucleotide-binding domain-containing protein [Synergistaceae bacterium]
MLISRQKELADRQREAAERKAERQKKEAERKKKLAKYQHELTELEQAYQLGSFQFFVVCGPEGSGKTMLVQEFCGWKKRIFFKASGKDIASLQSFAERLQGRYDKPCAFTDWKNAFKYVADKEQEKNRMSERLVLVLHEFPDPVRRDDKFMEMFKEAIEQNLSRTKIFLILVSSDMEFSQKYFLGEDALLHKNMSGCIRIENMTLDDDEAEKIADEAARMAKGISNARMKIQKFSADDIILREGETNDAIYKIITGSAVCWFKYGTDDEYVLSSVADGECFVEYSVLTGEPSIYTVVAFSDMIVMKITKDDLITFVEMNAKNAIDIMGNTARMLNVMAMNIDMLRSEGTSSNLQPDNIQ